MNVLQMQSKKYKRIYAFLPFGKTILFASRSKKPRQGLHLCRRNSLAFFIFAVFVVFHAARAASLAAQDNALAAAIGPPLITRLDPASDVVFKQYSDDVAAGNQVLFSHKGSEAKAAALTIYQYQMQRSDDLLRVAKSTILGSYSSIVTLNRISHMPLSGLNPTVPILLPSIRGIFMPQVPTSDLELLIASSRGDDAGVPISITTPAGKQVMRFIPGDDFKRECFNFILA
ncbi:MAG: hypothetical protein Ta2G_21190 [Termitinemataceae bacterium]|nr:MAG: hypothetical protein Ta2G_21190 [Termitinemataceae bacterium]